MRRTPGGAQSAVCSLRCVLMLGLVLMTACARPIDRPLSGAPPPTGEPHLDPISQVGAPPTLAPPTQVPSNPDRTDARNLRLTLTAAPLVAAERLVLRSIQPAPNAEVDAGEVRIAALIQTFGNLATISVTLNGRPVEAEVSVGHERNWMAFFSESLEPGEHDVRVVARDSTGRSGDLEWRFKVLPNGETSASPTASPMPTPALAPQPPKPQATPTPAPKPQPSPTPTPRPQASATPAAKAPPTPTPAAKPKSGPTATAAPPKAEPKPTGKPQKSEPTVAPATATLQR